MRPQLIAFTGPATSGKTTAAQHFVTAHGFHRTSFAKPLREMLMALGLSKDDLQSGKETPHPLLGGKTPRWALQSLGTQWGRDLISPDLWVNAARARAKQWLECGYCPVFDDCRFDNEARMVRELGGYVVEIVRPGLGRGTHESERGVSSELVNLFVLNDGAPTKLHNDLDYLFQL